MTDKESNHEMEGYERSEVTPQYQLQPPARHQLNFLLVLSPPSLPPSSNNGESDKRKFSKGVILTCLSQPVGWSELKKGKKPLLSPLISKLIIPPATTDNILARFSHDWVFQRMCLHLVSRRIEFLMQSLSGSRLKLFIWPKSFNVEQAFWLQLAS